MISDEEQLKQLLKKHRSLPASPVDPDVLLRHKKDTLLEIYKRNRKATWFSAAAVSLLFTLKKAGISVSLMHSYLIMIAAPVVLVTGIAAGTIITIQHKAHEILPSVISAKAEPEKPAPVQSVSPSLSIQSFRHDERSTAAAARAEEILFAEISRHKGRGFAAHGSSLLSAGTVAGSIISSDDGFTVSIRRIDSNANVVFLKQETLKDESEIERFVKKAAEEISRR